jgi:O-antigen/teichoic acid export membrane protein
MLAAQVFYVFVFLWTMTLSAFRKMKLAAISALSAGAVNLVLNLLLIPGFGITGAAVAILLTILVHAILAGHALSHFIRISCDIRAIRNIILSASVMAMYILIIRISFPVQHAVAAGFLVLTGALIYFLILIRLERGIESGIKQMIRETGLVLPDWI